ncbi:MAG: hypothetical protein IJQ32_03300 [Paludibacteraceae bacterium]|nr:hypothetical protein [Paludibacteraceae bacterium]
MKTMTEQECRAFVMSGFIPTSNEDIADIQDCFNHQSVDFQIGLLLNVETHTKAVCLMRACLHTDDEVDHLLAQSNEIAKMMTKRDQYEGHIEHLEKQIADMKHYLKETEEQNNRYVSYLK